MGYNRDTAFGRVALETADGTQWVIDRHLDKYTKKSKGEELIEAKTSVEFNSHYDDVVENHNGMTRAETDKIIRSKFGTVDDFLLTSMSSQLDSLSFIREGSTKRKEIFAVGVAYDMQEVQTVPKEKSDFQLDAILTEKRVILREG